MGEHYNKPMKHRKFKRIAVTLVAVFSACLVLTIATSAMGFNIIELLRNAINSPDRATTNDGADAVVGDTQHYDSVYDLVESVIDTSRHGIVFFAQTLPDGYGFTDFRVHNYDSLMEVLAIGSEPPIRFSIHFGSNFSIDRYEYRATNGFRYNIDETHDGMYQASWVHSGDYYVLVANDIATLTEIMNNLSVFHRGNLSGADVQYEVSSVYRASNGIAYIIVQFAEELFQTHWNYEGNSYSLTVADREIIAEIIESIEIPDNE